MKIFDKSYVYGQFELGRRNYFIIKKSPNAYIYIYA